MKDVYSGKHLRPRGGAGRWITPGLLGVGTATLFPSVNAVHGGTMHMFVVFVAAFAWKLLFDVILNRKDRAK